MRPPPRQVCTATAPLWQPPHNTRESLNSTCQLHLTSGSPWHPQQMSSSTRASCYRSIFHHAFRWLRSSLRVQLKRAYSQQALPQQHHTSHAMHRQQIHVMPVVSSMRSTTSMNAYPLVVMLPRRQQPRADELSNSQFKTWRKNPISHIRSNRYIASPVSNRTTLGTKLREDECGHRRSFSSVIIRYSSPNKPSSVSSSSCSSSNSSSFSIPSSNDSSVGPVLRRSSSASSEMDNPIQGAIAYCKKSQQLASVRKSASDAGFRFMSSSTSKIAAESEDTDGIFDISQNINVNSMFPQ